VFDCGEYAAIAPAAPTGLTITPGGAQAALAWTAPTNTGGVAITDYRIQYSFNGGSYTTFSHAASAATSATITGLATGNYVFRVAAVNSVGTGPDVTSSSTSISASASVLTMTRSNNGGVITTWGSGIGTTGSPFFRATAVEWANVDGLSRYSWTANGSATVTVSFTFNDDQSEGYQAYVKKGSSTMGNSIASGSATRTFTVVSGDVITITADNAGVGQYFDNVSVSAA
jgi:titin